MNSQDSHLQNTLSPRTSNDQQADISLLASKNPTQATSSIQTQNTQIKTSLSVFQHFPVERFPYQIDQFFICLLCEGVVYKPKECTTCQNLVCKKCILKTQKCPYDCQAPVFTSLSRFAKIFYYKTLIRCAYYIYGCEFTCRIRLISTHQSQCSFRPQKCLSPICQNFLIGVQVQQKQGICSNSCKVVIQYANGLYYMSKKQRLTQFQQIIKISRKLLKQQVQSQLQSELGNLENLKRTTQKFLVKKQKLNKMLLGYRKFYHKGE